MLIRKYSTTNKIELIRIIAMLTFTSTFVVFAITPPASIAMAEDSKRTCELVMARSPLRNPVSKTKLLCKLNGLRDCSNVWLIGPKDKESARRS